MALQRRTQTKKERTVEISRDFFFPHNFTAFTDSPALYFVPLEEKRRKRIKIKKKKQKSKKEDRKENSSVPPKYLSSHAKYTRISDEIGASFFLSSSSERYFPRN